MLAPGLGNWPCYYPTPGDLVRGIERNCADGFEMEDAIVFELVQFVFSESAVAAAAAAAVAALYMQVVSIETVEAEST